MKRLKVLGWVVAFLVVFGVFTHMASLFVIGAVVIAGRLIAYVATDPVSGVLVGLAAVLAGYVVGRATDMAIRTKHRSAA